MVEKDFGYLAVPSQPAADYVLGDTQAAVAEQLIDRYYRKELLDEDEISYKAWLQAFVDGTRKG